MNREHALSLAATSLAGAGLAVCLAFPWFGVTIETEGKSLHDAIYLWTNDSTFHAGISAWFIAGLFFASVLSTRLLIARPRTNGGLLTVAGAVILTTLLVQLFGRAHGMILESVHYIQGWAPILLLPISLVLIVIAVELMRLPAKREPSV